MHMSVLPTYMYMYHMHAVLLKVSMGHWFLCSWGYGWLWTTNHPCGCCNQASTLNPWAISQAPDLILSWCWHLKEAEHVNSKLSLLKDIILNVLTNVAWNSITLPVNPWKVIGKERTSPYIFCHTTDYPQLLKMLKRWTQEMLKIVFPACSSYWHYPETNCWNSCLFVQNHKELGQIFPCSCPFIFEMRVFQKHVSSNGRPVSWFYDSFTTCLILSELFNFVSSLTSWFLKGEWILLSETW